MRRIYSLKGRNLFREVYQKGRKLQDSGIRVFIFKCRSDNHVKPDMRKQISPRIENVKLAVILAKSFGKANTRNKAKRRIRAICSELINHLKNGFCIIIKVDADFKNLQFIEIKSIIRALFMKAGLIKRDADTGAQ